MSEVKLINAKPEDLPELYKITQYGMSGINRDLNDAGDYTDLEVKFKFSKTDRLLVVQKILCNFFPVHSFS